MSIIAKLKSITFEKLLIGVGFSIAVIYLFSMFVFPWVELWGNWSYVQEVWARWQSLNAAMIAFLSALIALYISRKNSQKQRKNDFVSSRVYLPETFSQLCTYFRESMRILQAAWSEESSPYPEKPSLPHDYREIFSRCIKYADPEVEIFLINILVELQVHDTRLQGVIDAWGSSRSATMAKHNLMSYIFSLGKLQALINKQYEFARGESNFDTSTLNWEDFRSAYRNIDVAVDDIHTDDGDNLSAFTRMAINRSAP